MQIFVYLSLRSYIRSGLGLAVYCKTGGFKVNFASALDFCYICPDGHIYAGTLAKLTSKLDVLLSAFAIFV